MMYVRTIRRSFAQFGAIAAIIFPGVSAGVFAGSFAGVTTAQAATSSKVAEKNFEQDLASVLGVTLKTKRGEMRLRQRKDLNGHVRKQIISGPGFSEIQLDQDGDGTVDFLEVTRGVKTVTVSHPVRGRFLRMTVSEKTTKGQSEALYLLSLNGRSYNLLKSRLIGKNVRLHHDGEVSERDFEAVDNLSAAAPQSLDADAVPLVSSVPDRTAGIDTEQLDWLERQKKLFGTELTCDGTDEASRLAALQRDWWKVLKYNVDDRTDKLVDKLKNSKMFNANCKTPARKKDFDKMVNGLATVMLSSSVGQPMPTDKTRGRYLRCLELSGLGVAAARMEKSFMSSLDDPYRTTSPISCEWMELKAGKVVAASSVGNQVIVHLTAAGDGKGATADGATNNYPNSLFHEFMHVGGFGIERTVDEEEALVHAAEACCGDPTKDRVGACGKLDGIVAKNSRYVEIETHLARVGEGLNPIRANLETMFSPSTANSLYKNFISGLDNYSKGSPPNGEYENGIISDVEYAKCVAKSTDAECRAKWTASIRKYADVFFTKQCQSLVLGSERKQCAKVSESFKDDFAKTIAASMIAPPDPCPGNKSNARSEIPGTYRETAAAMTLRWIFGNDVQAEGAYCSPVGEIGAPSCPPTPETPASSVPDEALPATSQTDIGTVAPKHVVVDIPAANQAGSSGRPTDDNTAGPSTGRTDSGRTRSPLPVIRVDSEASGRSYVEDQYRRATDVVGSTSKLRDAILPKAVAGERSEKKSARLGPDDKFIPYKPEEPREFKVKLDNPFAAQRGIASISDISVGKNGKATGIQASADRAKTGSGISANGEGPTTAAGDSATNASATGGGSNAEARAGKLTSTTSSASSTATMMTSKSVGGLQSNAKDDVLVGLFTSPYREIEPRLKRLDVIEALISRKISIQDSTGRMLGSNRPVDRYVFNGLAQPLSKQGKR